MTTVKPLRAEAMRAGFEALRSRLPEDYGFAQFERALADWKVEAFCQGEKVIGMLMTKGPELHVAVLPEARGKWLSRRLIREVFAPIVAEHGAARTTVMADNKVGLDFVRRIRAGFASLEFDPISVATSIGGSLITGALQADAAQSAANTQANAANQATQAQLQMFNTQNQQQAPYRQAGYNALSALLGGFGLPGGQYEQTGAPKAVGGITQADLATPQWKQVESQFYAPYGGFNSAAFLALPQDQQTAINTRATAAFNAANPAHLADAQQSATASTAGGVPQGYFSHQFDANDLKTNLAPNYDFQLQQGLGATKNAANLQTGLLSGNALKGINDYAQNFAGNAYQQAFNNYTANQSNIFNRLSSVAGLGQAANTQSAGLAGSLAPGIAGTIQGAGAAQAAGTIGQANALTGAGNSALGWYNIGNILNQNAATPVSQLEGLPGQYSLSNSQYGG